MIFMTEHWSEPSMVNLGQAHSRDLYYSGGGSSGVVSNNRASFSKTLQPGIITMTNTFSSSEINPRKRWLELKMFLKHI